MFAVHTQSIIEKKLADMGLALPMVLSQKSLKHDIDDLIALHFEGLKLAVIADANTDTALAASVMRALKNRFNATFVFLSPSPSADMNVVEFIQYETKRCDALVAVGSGTINDLCKYAAFADGKPYIVFPTAASMNGYLSANASISVDGYKKTLPAQMPKAVFCDLEVIATAPVRLNKSGLGDSLARPTAQADWLMSHLVLGTAYDNTAFELLKDVESELFDSARGIAKRDAKTTELLIKTLLLSGLGMTIAKGSYPASQGEHMIAHTHEMMLARRPQADKTLPTLHGEEIGVTTLTMANLQQSMLRQKPAVRAKSFPKQVLFDLLGDKTTKEAAKAYQIKTELIRNNSITVDWSFVASQLEPIMLSPEHIVSILKAAEAPYQHETLGWKDQDYTIATSHACYLRERFTFLDLVL